MGDILVADAKSKILEVPGIKEAEVELVFDPPWTQDKMSEAARLQAGLI
jgi:metal-sulfur cluster biosynthetic enzyme